MLLDGTQKSIDSYFIGAYYHMKYVFLLSILLSNLKWRTAILNGGWGKNDVT